jgi:hypothetical protein
MGKIGSFKLQIFCSNQNALELKVTIYIIIINVIKFVAIFNNIYLIII